MSSNPYQAFFDKLDATIAALDNAARDHLVDGEAVAALATDASELLKRAGFVLGNLINAQSQVYPMLFLPADTPEPDNEDTEGTSLEQQADPSADARR